MADIVIVVVLLVFGYGFGSYREKRHYTSIRERESAMQDIMVFESRFAPDTQETALNPNQHTEDPQASSFDGGELVFGNVVISTDYFKMFVASLRKLVGGRLRSYESLLDRGRREAVLRMKEQARTRGANRIFNVRFETSSISQGASGNLGSIEVFAYGSALKE
jgi:uncharacterized protein YbjQ (UPF0145 family)